MKLIRIVFFLFKNLFALLTLISISSLAQFGQMTNAQNFQVSASLPVADHHLHLMSLNLSAFLTEPLLPEIKLPAEFEKLLRDKEKFGGNIKNPAALGDLYTKDLLVQEPQGPTFFRGERAVQYIINSTVINRLLPTAYDITEQSGYIAGYEVSGVGANIQYLDNFLYVVKKKSDGKWRISVETFTIDPPRLPKALTAEKIIKDLDEAGIKNGAVLSLAYMFGTAFQKSPKDEYAKVRAENDWVAEQVALFPDRLIGFCSFNPIKGYALEELKRCAADRRFKGVKLHLGNSGVKINENPQHVERLRQIFRLANENRLAIVIHFWTSPAYEIEGGAHAKVFLEQILPEAPDIPIQIAHLAGGGRSTDPALKVFAEAISANDPRTKNLYFDVATSTGGQTNEALKKDAERMRQIGLNRILYGSDMAPPNPTPLESWETFRKRMPLTAEELKTIAENVAPYLRR